MLALGAGRTVPSVDRAFSEAFVICQPGGASYAFALFMLSFLFKRLAGRHYRKFLEAARPVVAKINEIEVSYQTLTDEQLKAKTDEFRARLKQGETLDQILPEAFATVKNAARRLCGQHGGLGPPPRGCARAEPLLG